MTTLEQVAALKDGRIDAGFGRLRFDDGTIVRSVIREERLCLVAPRGHKLAAKKGKLRLRRRQMKRSSSIPSHRVRATRIRFSPSTAMPPSPFPRGQSFACQ